ncbi:hypothetical protein NE235_03350 [Actinoallomurus spadix]|uniref:DUF998 domain-containing protein n=1 Tax=Actinoallomurus spadix TaxID=79912 RepID=A0ABN0XM73_9ACTN|nr:hypothetical protein [Actinoallomurus spadix]MCO5985141.1 hypothetical protein [Actinoallomurus spadix]
MSVPQEGETRRAGPQVDLSRLLPLAGLLAVILGVGVVYLPARWVVLCDDAPGFRHFEALDRTMWRGIEAAFLVAAIALVTLFSRRRRTPVTVLRSVLLAVVVTLVVVQAFVGSEATRVGTGIFHSQTCDEPGASFELPDGPLQP